MTTTLGEPARRLTEEYEPQDLGDHLRVYYGHAPLLGEVSAQIVRRGHGGVLVHGSGATPAAALAEAMERLAELHAVIGGVLP